MRCIGGIHSRLKYTMWDTGASQWRNSDWIAGVFSRGPPEWRRPARKCPIRARRPNILHIMTDQQQWATIAGRSGCRTPNYRPAGTRGLLFERSYTPSAVCCPARAMLLSGAYHWHNGVYNQVHSPPLRASRHEPRCRALLAAPARCGLSPGLCRQVARELTCARRLISVSTKWRELTAAIRRCCKAGFEPRSRAALDGTAQGDQRTNDALAGVGTLRDVGLQRGSEEATPEYRNAELASRMMARFAKAHAAVAPGGPFRGASRSLPAAEAVPGSLRSAFDSRAEEFRRHVRGQSPACIAANRKRGER